MESFFLGLVPFFSPGFRFVEMRACDLVETFFFEVDLEHFEHDHETRCLNLWGSIVVSSVITTFDDALHVEIGQAFGLVHRCCRLNFCVATRFV